MKYPLMGPWALLLLNIFLALVGSVMIFLLFALITDFIFGTQLQLILMSFLLNNL